jgi:hypothetical protein
VASTVLARVPFSHCRSNLSFHLSAILFRLQASAMGATLIVSLNFTRRLMLSRETLAVSDSCSSTWHGAGIDKNKNLKINTALFYVVPRCCWFLCLQSPVDVSWGDYVVPLQRAWRWAKTCCPRVCYTM